jgi:LacI family repressor for deo operon, udp, cdd, tsx, nupC, and nupG
MQVTQHDIAKEAKVSRSLVSMALNNSGRVDAKTRQRILAAARKLGYRQNLIGKSMRTGQSMTVGVLIRGMDAYFGKMLAGVQETLQKNGYVPITLSVSKEFNLLDQVQRLLEQRVDGIIIKPESQLYEESIRDILHFNVPLVTVDNYIAGAENVDFSGVNDSQLGTLAAQHFLELGHKKLAAVTIAGDLHLDNRISSFRRIMEENSGSIDVFEAEDYEDYSWEDAVVNSAATGIFFMSDVMAAQFIQNTRKKGFVVPKDFSVLGTGNVELARFCSPALTTFDQHSYNIGSNAVKLLLERMAGELPAATNSRQILEMPTLVQRESTAVVTF